MINELGCRNAGVERPYRGREGHRADAWEKLGKEAHKQQAFFRGLEHHGKIMKRKNCVLGKKIGRTSPSYIGLIPRTLSRPFRLMLAGTS